jgi:ribonuclease J
MVRLTAYGGVFEIGGNKILLQDRDTKVFLDFGVSFNAEGQYFNGGISPRKVNGIGDYLEFGLLPKLQGLYAEEQLKQTEIPYRPAEYQGVFVSHAHADHVGYVHFLDGSIPVHCGETSKIILNALNESGAFDIDPSSLKGFRTGARIRADNIEIEPIHVDHSIPGAYGFIIHTTEGTLVYTGDLRLHGPVAHMTDEFVSKAAEQRPFLMLCEGTRVGQKESPKLHSEMEVQETTNRLVSHTSKLVTTSFYGRDIDRINTFYSVAQSNNRKFVTTMKTALLLTKLKEDIHLSVPDVLSDENILVYKKRKRTGAYDEKDYYKWERPYLDKAVDHKYIHDNQSRVIVAIEPKDFTELIDVKPDPGGHYIYSMSEPHSEVEEVDEEIQRNWLTHFGIEFHQIHASGHAPPEDIRKIIDRIKPRTLIPVHTEYPDKFLALTRKGNSRVMILKKAQIHEVK